MAYQTLTNKCQLIDRWFSGFSPIEKLSAVPQYLCEGFCERL